MEQLIQPAGAGESPCQASWGAWVRAHRELAAIIVLVGLSFVFAITYELGTPLLERTDEAAPQADPGREPASSNENDLGSAPTSIDSGQSDSIPGDTPSENPDSPVVSTPGTQFVDVPPTDAVSTEITGTFTCLPKKGSGPQTMECAFGVRERTTGDHYALRVYGDIPLGGLEGEGERTYVGLLSRTLPPGNTYDTVGILFVQSVR